MKGRQTDKKHGEEQVGIEVLGGSDIPHLLAALHVGWIQHLKSVINFVPWNALYPLHCYKKRAILIAKNFAEELFNLHVAISVEFKQPPYVDI